jgi:hypothetical protein
VKLDGGDAVWLLGEQVGGCREEFECEVEFLVHGCSPFRVGEWCAGQRWGAVNPWGGPVNWRPVDELEADFGPA